ncbi:GerAB/ArcD/ProY family transporter [Blautia sp. HCP3S3_H10_1]|uniref:GerAB/ArcD/ProY family transporter n=1 Tax=unclassified Blautia TaxID=2648079 RepID=UPI003F8DB1C0|nr:GerAB/ArcD/ProY family transporter [Clostridia bacterium]
MKFAENNRISQRQLYRQIVIAFIAPFLLCLFGKRQTLGLSGLTGTVLALIAVLFYVIFLVRLRHAFGNPCKTAGQIGGRLVGVFFLIYCIWGATFLLDLLGEIVAVSLGTGVAKGWLCLLALLVCSMGTHRGIQRRGRIGEVSGGVVLAAVLLMLFLSIGQGKWEYLQEMVWNSSFSEKKILESGYGVICAFSGLGMLPFSLDQTVRKKENSTGKTVSLAVFTLGVLLILTELLLSSVLGWGRLKYENYPILPLLAGADLPGNVLARFDILWMGFLLYSLLFSIGSLLHYGHLIVEKSGLGTGRLWIPLLVYGGIVAEMGAWSIRDYFPLYLEYIFVPGMLIIQIVFFIIGKKRWKKKLAAAACASAIFFLTGCGGVEPEKRLYPLALGVDLNGGNLQVTYGVPDLPKSTGQEKNGEDQGNAAPSIVGESFEEIENLYGRTQEKYLDMGHLEILVLGQALLDGGRWEQALAYLKQESVIGENVYVFCCDNASEAVAWTSPQETSLGEYLLGLLENNPNGSPGQAVTLREVYHEFYDRGALPSLPEIKIQGAELEVIF